MAHKLPKLPPWVKKIMKQMEAHLGVSQEKLEPFIRQLLQEEREWVATTLNMPTRDPQVPPALRVMIKEFVKVVMARMDSGLPCPTCKNGTQQMPNNICPTCKGTKVWHQVVEMELNITADDGPQHKTPLQQASNSPLLISQGGKVQRAGLIPNLERKEEPDASGDNQT